MIVAAALLCGASGAASIDKEAAYAEMLSLAQQMKDLKGQIGSNPQAVAAYEAAARRYGDLSAALGGDDPGQVLDRPVSTAAIPARATGAPGVVGGGCGEATATFTQSTPTAIPTGPAVVTSTLVVSGVGPFLFDLNLTTFMAHTFPGDLDVTLTSPAGTVVTLTTDNAGTNDNVFNGTVWDDDANPAGQVPYTTNNGLVTDHAYVLATLASPLVPEEGLAAFVGEDPNGTWTITISDDAAQDGGSLDSWSLEVTTFAAAPTVANTAATQATPTAIPTGPAVVTSTIVIAGAGTSILDVDVTTFMAHTFPGDLDVTLTSPAGTVVTLTTDNAGTNDNVFNGTVWDDDANPAGQVPYTTNNGLATDHAYVLATLASPLAPEEALGAFIGEDPNGTWTITISDDAAQDGGSLDSWSLDIDTFTCAPTDADLSVTKTDGTASATPGGSTIYTITVSNAGPADANPASLVDTFPAACTSVSYTSVAAGGASGNTAGPAAGNINDTALNLPAGSSVTYTATCTISPAAVGTLDNTATVSSTTPDPDPADNSATDSDTLGASADLALTKTLTTPPPINIGDNVVFALTVTNNGPSAATGVTVTDTLPAGLTYVSNDCGASFAAPTLTWNVGALAVSASATCNLTVTVTQAGPIVNSASVSGNEPDPTPGNDTDVETVSALPGTVEIPTLDTVGLMALVVLLAASAAVVLRRRRRVS